MKSKLLSLIILIGFIAFFISCGPSAEEKKQKAKEDSIKKEDSIHTALLNKFVGHWAYFYRGKDDPRWGDRFFSIERDGEIFTVTNIENVDRDEGALNYKQAFSRNIKTKYSDIMAYKLDGQSIFPIDADGYPFSLVNDKLLWAGFYFEKVE